MEEKVIQFISTNPGKSGVTRLMDRVSRRLKIPVYVIKKTVKEYVGIKEIGDSGDTLMSAVLTKV